MSKAFFFFFFLGGGGGGGGGVEEKKSESSPLLHVIAGPAERFSKWEGGGVGGLKYLRSDRAKQVERKSAWGPGAKPGPWERLKKKLKKSVICGCRLCDNFVHEA